MEYLFEVLGDSEGLARAEVRGVVEAYGHGLENIEEDEGVLVASTELEQDKLGKRLGLTRHISRHLVSGDLDSLRRFFGTYSIDAGSFCVRAKRMGGKMPEISASELQASIGALLAKRSKVELESPEAEVRIVISKRLHAGLKLADIERSPFEGRKVRHRPFFSPISLHPKLARALVNLTRVPDGGTLLDPFCGTGGILIEAAMAGARIFGSDISDAMVHGCRRNLGAQGIEGEIFRADVSEIPARLGAVDAIATDPPYGRSASTGGEDVSSLYERSFGIFRRVLKKGGHAAMILPRKENVELGKRHLELREVHEVRVHSSLTRYFALFRNS